MKVFGYGQMSYELIYPFLCPFASMVRIIAFSKYNTYYTDFLFSSLVVFLAEIAGGLLHFISDKKSRREKEKKRLSSLEIQKKSILEEYLYSNSEDSEVKRPQSLVPAKVIINEFSFINIQIPILGKNTVLVSIFIIALLDFISFNILSFVCSYKGGVLANDLQSETRNVKIIITIIFGLIFFKYEIYNHQILSIILILIGFFSNIILTFIENNLTIDFLYILLGFLFTYVITTLILFWEKSIMEKERISPYKLLFLEGIFGTIINLLAFIPSYYINCTGSFSICNGQLYNIGNTITHMKETDFWIFLVLLFVSSLCFNVFVRLSLHCFTPTHLNVSDALSTVMYWGYVKIANMNKEDIFISSYYPLPGYILIIVGTLIYNEILIFYFCNFEYNTKKEITLRAENDVRYTVERNKANTMKSEDIEIGKVIEE